jgi:maleylacetate reductase
MLLVKASTRCTQTHAIILPYALSSNSAASPEAMHESATRQAASALRMVSSSLDEGSAPSGLRETGMQESDLDKACEIATSSRASAGLQARLSS